MSLINEYRGLGYSWPKAFRSSIDIKARIGWAVWNVGQAICRTGEKLGGGY
jgi:hypothetical protein